MHTYEIKDKNVDIYLDDAVVAFAHNWDTLEGAEEWAKAMVAKLDYDLANPETEADA